jgi:MFS family permease
MNILEMSSIIDLKPMIYVITLIITIGLVYWIYKKYELTKYQMMVFILLVLFWSSINIIRAYRKVYATSPLEFGGIGLDGIVAANIVAAYGLISVFARLPVFMLSDFLTSRKKIIGFALLAILLTSLSVVVKVDAYTLFASSLALGIGASILSLFNVMFAETFTPKQAMVSVSILSIAPLLAEFFVAPIQSFATSGAIKNYGMLWLISAILAFVAFMFLLLVKDNKQKVRNFTVDKFKKVLFDQRFLMIAFLAVAVSFIRFASGQANMVAYARSELVLMNNVLVAYLDVMFSIFQLIAGVAAGLYLKKKIGTKNTLYIGLASVFVFSIVASSSTNPTLLFLVYGLNGFGYGILYNVLLGLALQPFDMDTREVSMGIYQTFFAIGIFYGDRVYALILQLIPSTFEGSALYQLVFRSISGLVVFLAVFVLVMFKNKNKEFIEA